MSFRPANFTDLYRSGPPTTANGREWTIRISKAPPAEWLDFFQKDASADSGLWSVNVQYVELNFSATPDSLPRAVEHFDQRIHRANGEYRRWLDEAHRKGDERRQGEVVEADRVRDLNERFKNL
jgi:hypothetical protein